VCVRVSGDGTHRPRRDCFGTNLTKHRRHQTLDVRRFTGSTSAGAWRHTLGMSTVPDNATASSRLLHQDHQPHCYCSSTLQALSSTSLQSFICKSMPPSGVDLAGILGRRRIQKAWLGQDVGQAGDTHLAGKRSGGGPGPSTEKTIFFTWNGVFCEFLAVFLSLPSPEKCWIATWSGDLLDFEDVQ